MVRDAVPGGGPRPTRLVVWALAQGLEQDAWRPLSMEQRKAALEPFIQPDERFHVANDGEVFLVPVETGGRPTGASAGKSLEQLQAHAAADRAFARARASLQREAFQEGYARGTAHLAAQYVELQSVILEKALSPDANEADRRLALASMKDWNDRVMGKAVQATEDVTTKATDVRTLMASSRPVLPVSASVTVEQVAEGARRELEAGAIVVDDE